MVKAPACVRFGVFEANFRRGELRKNGNRIKLQEKPLQVLSILVEQPGELVSREELQKRLWPSDVFVDFDNGLNTAVNKLREALGDSADSPRFIETVPRRGYRFIAGVEVAPEAAAAAVGSTSAPVPAVAEVLEVPARAAEAAPPQPRVRNHPSPRMVVAVAVVLVVVAATAIGLRQVMRSRRAAGPVRSLAVLPLENQSGDKDKDYFADGMTDALTSELASIPGLRVPSRTTVETYRRKNIRLPQIAAELNVDAIVEGSVLLSGERIRITVNLLDARTDKHLWTDSYDRDRSDVFALQDEVARAIAQAVQVTLTSKQRPLNPQAYDAYMRGRHHWNKRTEDELMRAIPYFEEAIAKDPKFAPAFAGLSDTLGLLGTAGYNMLRPADAMPRAKQAALNALRIDDTLAEAHASVAYVSAVYEWNWAAAEKEFQRAIELNPRYSTARQWYAEFLAAMGRLEDAMVQVKAAEETDPASLIVQTAVAEILYFQRNYDAVIAQCNKTLQRDGNFAMARFHAGRAYLQKRMFKEAVGEFQQLDALFGHNPTSQMALGYALGRAGRMAEAEQILGQLRAISRHRYVPAIYLAAVNAGMDRKNDALALLQEAFRERSDYLIYLNVDPWADSYRADPRFQDLLRRIGLPPTK